jgi:broad specificity phosphatase PhoE
MTQVFVARHGETDWNREGRWQGQGGPGLNATGRDQAAALAARLAAVRLDALYTSDLARAVQTAEIIAAVTGLVPVLEPGLREVDNGDWRGLTRAQVRAANPAGYRRWLN